MNKDFGLRKTLEWISKTLYLYNEVQYGNPLYPR